MNPLKDYKVTRVFPQTLFLVDPANHPFRYFELTNDPQLFPAITSQIQLRNSLPQNFLKVKCFFLKTANVVGIICPPKQNHLPHNSTASLLQIYNSMQPLMKILKEMKLKDMAHQQITIQDIVYKQDTICLADYYNRAKQLKPLGKIENNLLQVGNIFLQIFQRSRLNSQPAGRSLLQVLRCMTSDNFIWRLQAFSMFQRISVLSFSEESPFLQEVERKKIYTTYSPPVTIKHKLLKGSPAIKKQTMAKEISPLISSPGSNSRKGRREESNTNTSFKITLIPTDQRKQQKKIDRVKQQQRYRKIMQMSNTFLNQIKNRQEKRKQMKEKPVSQGKRMEGAYSSPGDRNAAKRMYMEEREKAVSRNSKK